MKNILSKTRNKFYPLFVIIISVLTALSSCDKNDDTFFNEIPDIDNPFEILPDPEGTIQLSMRDDDNGKTLLDNIYISDENFASNYVWPGNTVTFVSLGSMNGLANIKQIPTTGWASKVSVVPGNGYIAYDRSKDSYYRLYVTNYIVSTTGGIIGADVKYQVPFYGKDEAILPETESLTFPANGGTQTVVFKNQGIIPFDIETDVSWCSVQKASTNNYSFLTNAIAITVDGSNDTEAVTGKITLKTIYGKETVINITRSGKEPFITTESSSISLTAAEQTKNVSFESNIEQDDLTVTSSAAWCKAEFLGTTSGLQTMCNEIKFIGDKPVSEIDENLSLYASVTKYLSVTVEENSSTQSREATITIRDKNDISVTIPVTQAGAGIIFSQEQYQYTATAQEKRISFSCDIDVSNINVTCSSEWCNVSFNKMKYIDISLDENISEESRNTVIYFRNKSNELLSQIKIVQEGAYLEISNKNISFDKNSNYLTIEIDTSASHLEAESSENWCTFSINGNNLTVRATASTSDRTAVISFKGFDTQITVRQSKYAVGDNYNENGIEGTVGYMGDEGRYIYRYLGKAAWSTENVATGATSWTDGEYNMEVIKRIPNWQELYPAFYLCDQLNTNGISGWYLPAINELVLIKRTDYPCSSTEKDVSSAYYYYPYSSTYAKDKTRQVYAVHKF